MAQAGADVLIPHMGLTTKGTIGAKTALTLDEAAERVQAMHDAAKGDDRPDILVLCHGGPIAEPEDAEYVLEHTQGIVGFFGASSIERLPTELAITGACGSSRELRSGNSETSRSPRTGGSRLNQRSMSLAKSWDAAAVLGRRRRRAVAIAHPPTEGPVHATLRNAQGADAARPAGGAGGRRGRLLQRRPQARRQGRDQAAGPGDARRTQRRPLLYPHRRPA